MPSYGSSPFAFPEFRGATRFLVVVNLAAYFLLLIFMTAIPATRELASSLVLFPADLLHGALWQPFTYSLIHSGLTATLFDLLSLWFLAGFLENFHGSRWVLWLYALSVLGTAVTVTLLYLVFESAHLGMAAMPLAGCMGGVFGLLTAIGALYGDMEFLLFFTIGMKARYMVTVYLLVALAMSFFAGQRLYAFAQMGGALAGYLYARMAPRHGRRASGPSPKQAVSEAWYGMRNRYYRWKRRQAAKKFEVYMKNQGRTVRFDGHGNRLDEDPDDRERWN